MLVRVLCVCALRLAVLGLWSNVETPRSGKYQIGRKDYPRGQSLQAEQRLFKRVTQATWLLRTCHRFQIMLGILVVGVNLQSLLEELNGLLLVALLR